MLAPGFKVEALQPQMPWMFFQWAARFEQGTGETWVDYILEAGILG